MHRTARAIVLSAAAFAAALGLCGCGNDTHPAASHTTDAPISNPLAPPPPAAPATAPLPPPTALTDVLVRLADPNISGADKVPLVQYATAGDAAALDRFGRAMLDGGFLPVTFEATDLTWSQDHRGNVIANIVVKTANRQAGDFRFPMEFSPIKGSWQLTRQTADMLLQLGQDPTATPTS